MMQEKRDAELSPVLKILYPEVSAGGFTRADGTIQFFTRIQALLKPHMTVLEFGAGRGAWTEEGSATHQKLHCIKGKVAELVGLDVDPVVLQNPTLDRALVIRPNEPLPLESSSVDLILADKTLEHLDHPEAVASEFARVLKDGGWICGRTPNRWSYVGVAARAVPNQLHASILSRLQPWRPTEDVFPTHYLANSKRQLRALFPPSAWSHHVYCHYPEPLYFGINNPYFLKWARFAQYLLPAPMLMVFVMKRPGRN